MTALSPAAEALVRLMGAIPRGPRREGVLALWLTLRLVEDLLLQPPPPERSMRRRVALLERRLSSLALPPPLRRGLASALFTLRDARRGDGPVILALLVGPAREGVSSEAAEVLARAAKAARD